MSVDGATVDLISYASTQLEKFRDVGLASLVTANSLGIDFDAAKAAVKLALDALVRQEAAAKAPPPAPAVEAKAPAVDLSAKIPRPFDLKAPIPAEGA